MAYRQIHTSIWKDEYFLDLAPNEKLLFIYLFSNDSSNLAGLYKISKKVIAFETCLDMDFINTSLAKFSRANKIHYDDGICWVVNLRKYNEYGSETTAKHINANLAAIPDCPIKVRYMEMWNIPCILQGYPTDTPCLTVTVTGTDTVTVAEAGAEKPAPPAAEIPHYNEPIEAERIWCKVTGMLTYPASHQDKRAILNDIIGKIYSVHGDKTIEYLRPFWNEWRSVKRDYSKTNTGWLEWAVAGEIPLTKEQREDAKWRQINKEFENANNT